MSILCAAQEILKMGIDRKKGKFILIMKKKYHAKRYFNTADCNLHFKSVITICQEMK